MVRTNSPFQKLQMTINSLPARQRAILLETLFRTTWQTEFRRILKRIDQRVARHPISEAQIRKLCEEVRAERYAKRRH